MQFRLVWVYGTLKQGHVRQRTMSQSRYLGVGIAEKKYKMVHISGVPALKEIEDEATPEHGIYGELYEINEETLAEMDKIEGVNQGLYKRRPIDLETINLAFLPLAGSTHDAILSKKAEGYIFAKDIGKARDVGSFWKRF